MSAQLSATDVYKIGRAIVRVLRNSGRTVEILRVDELLGRPRYAAIAAQLAGDPAFVSLLAERPQIGSDTVDLNALRRLPSDTLGARYAAHLDRHDLALTAAATAPRFTRDPTVSYLMQRTRQAHDIWHSLLELGISGHEEVLLHAFTFGQLRLPVSALVVLFGAAKHMLLEARLATLRHSLWEAYTSGRDATPLLAVRWEQLWPEPIETLRRRFRIRPLTRAHIGH